MKESFRRKGSFALQSAVIKMKEAIGHRAGFSGYEYKEVRAESAKASLYLDCYANFGWAPDENIPLGKDGGQTILRLKRDRKIANKMELTRLQRHFESCINQIGALEQAKTSRATALALAVGVAGTAFMAGSVFAVTHEPPLVWLCVLLGIPGFLGWIFPYFVFQRVRARQAKKLEPLLEEKYDELYEVCEKGNALLQ